MSQKFLKGASNIIDKIEFIGVDGTPERGKKESTIDFAINFLLKNNFEIISPEIQSTYTGLFRNRLFKK